ncbi:MAG: ABC transporter ATP-binding protein, partial [Parvularculaceae bacterium]|nr:ABC transporter ATP-binding protein [Parvularculaceae bacterium]
VAAGLEPLQAGRVAVAGAVVAEGGRATPPEKRPIGFVFQDFVLFPHLTAAGNVAFGLSGPTKRARALDELAAVGLGDLGERYPHQLSGGQQQRVALARAFARRPQAMLLDEPFAAIDAVLRRKLRADLRALLKGAGAATVLVTHDPEEALALADRIAVMRAGRIIETATPEALFRNPLTPEGAQIFPSAQRVIGEVRSGLFRSAFGQAAAPALADGPAVAVAHEGGVTAAEDRSGAARVVDCRFRGPGWIATIEAGGERATVPMLSPLPQGAALATALHAANLRIFTATPGA